MTAPSTLRAWSTRIRASRALVGALAAVAAIWLPQEQAHQAAGTVADVAELLLSIAGTLGAVAAAFSRSPHDARTLDQTVQRAVDAAVRDAVTRALSGLEPARVASRTATGR